MFFRVLNGIRKDFHSLFLRLQVRFGDYLGLPVTGQFIRIFSFYMYDYWCINDVVICALFQLSGACQPNKHSSDVMLIT